MIRIKFFAMAVLFTAACGPASNDSVAVGQDQDIPLGSYEHLFAGAPDNSTLPSSMKADGDYPQQFNELVSLQSPVKSQGRRGVCSIFATTALMEHLYLKAGHASPDFSEQYLQWSVKVHEQAFPGSAGSNAAYNLRAITRNGLPVEAAWPYEIDQWGADNDPACTGKDPMPTRCYTNGDPPEAAQQAEKYKLPSSSYLNTRSIKDHLFTKKTAVVVGLDFFYQAWNHRSSTLPTNGGNWNQGVVLYPNKEDIAESHKHRAGHAVLIVGWDDELEVPVRDQNGEVVTENGAPVTEKGFYIFKNSWGTSGFGIENPYGAGFGFIAKRYVEQYGSAQSSDVPQSTNPTGTKQKSFDGSVAKGATAVHSVTLGAGAKNIIVQMEGTGDADLYTRFGAQPTANDWDCRPYRSGSTESCEHKTATDTHLEIMVLGFADEGSNYTLKVTWEE